MFEDTISDKEIRTEVGAFIKSHAHNFSDSTFIAGLLSEENQI